MSLRPRALASVQGDPREHYTAYRFQGFVLFHDEEHGQRESSCASPDRAETQQKMLSIGVSTLVNSLPIRLEVFK